MNEEMREPTEEEIRALQEQMRNVRVEDVVLQTVVPLINIAAMRLGLTGDATGKDVDQARMAIDAARALLPFTPSEEAQAVKDALSHVQMAFAREAQSAPAAEPGEAPAAETPPAAQTDEEAERQKARSKLWTPPGT